MSGHRPTRIERLGKDVCDYIDSQLELNWTRGVPQLEEITREVEQKFGCKLARNTVSKYKNKCWAPARPAVQEMQRRLQVIEERLGPAAITESLKATLAEEFHKAIRAGQELGAEFTANQLRLWAQQEANLERIKNEKLKLELQVEEMKNRVKSSVDEAEDKIRGGEPITVDDINRIRERTFGLPAKNTNGE